MCGWVCLWLQWERGSHCCLLVQQAHRHRPRRERCSVPRPGTSSTYGCLHRICSGLLAVSNPAQHTHHRDVHRRRITGDHHLAGGLVSADLLWATSMVMSRGFGLTEPSSGESSLKHASSVRTIRVPHGNGSHISALQLLQQRRRVVRGS